MKIAISGVHWGCKSHLTREIQKRTAEANAEKQRAYDLYQRAIARSKRNSVGLGG
jgi:hypothetical protein